MVKFQREPQQTVMLRPIRRAFRSESERVRMSTRSWWCSCKVFVGLKAGKGAMPMAFVGTCSWTWSSVVFSGW